MTRFPLFTISGRIITIIATAFMAVGSAQAQSLFDEIIVDGEEASVSTIKEPANYYLKGAAKQAAPSLWDLTDENGNTLNPEDFGAMELLPDPLMNVDYLTLQNIVYIPLVFDKYSAKLALDAPVSPLDSTLYNWNATMLNPQAEAALLPANNWTSQYSQKNDRTKRFVQNFMIQHPDLVRYNFDDLPEPPKQFIMEVDPQQAKINVVEIKQDRKQMLEEAPSLELDRINWLQNLDASLQFSQAYVSPNWYQGGNSNLNAIANFLYNVSLNQAFHPNVIFDTSIQYKLGLNNAPDDSIHAYSISEDLLQINSKFGYKAAKHWYYSITAQFKTQMLNNYKPNTNDLKASFMSPADLNVGVGMTYDWENPKKTVKFTAALSALSYNLKMCFDNRLDPTNFGIDQGKHTKSQYGSSTEITFKWKMAYNIEYFTRIFAFTDYSRATMDWENTLNFNINRFLTTRIFAHVRYQSDSPRIEGERWHLWQVKEILSIGFAYKFSRS